MVSTGAPTLCDAPRQGEDGEAILRELGYAEAEIATLLAGPVRLP